MYSIFCINPMPLYRSFHPFTCAFIPIAPFPPIYLCLYHLLCSHPPQPFDGLAKSSLAKANICNRCSLKCHNNTFHLLDPNSFQSLQRASATDSMLPDKSICRTFSSGDKEILTTTQFYIYNHLNAPSDVMRNIRSYDDSTWFFCSAERYYSILFSHNKLYTLFSAFALDHNESSDRTPLLLRPWP